MGCAASRIDKDERVRICRDRKRLMKQLLRLRGEFANAQFAYLRSLKNTGVTLRQFTESDSLELENTPYGRPSPCSPPPPLPPSPPPPPTFSPDLRNADDNLKGEVVHREGTDIAEDGSSVPPLPMPSYFWEEWMSFPCSSPHYQPSKRETMEQVDDENWAETKTDFGEDDQEEEIVSRTVPEKPQPEELVDDSLLMMSSYTKDSTDMTMALCRSKKTLDGIIKELDDYFLKASDGGKEISILMDINNRNTFLPQNFKENKRKRSNSPKVFSVLSWSWASKSLQFAQGGVGLYDSSEPCRPGAHCVVLAKLYAAEQKLYKDVKEEQVTKLEHEKKSMLLQKQEDENYNWIKTEKTRSCVEKLENDIRILQQSINETCSSILKIIEEELYPQLVALISGLMHMWRKMYECHRVQKLISLRLSQLTDNQSKDFTTDSHQQATAQLETEVTYWYLSFCKLTTSQREYVRTLCGWIKLTDCLVDDQKSSSSSAIRRLCEDWQLVFDKLPDKVTAEAIKSFLSAIQLIFGQQIEERTLHKKSDRLETRLEKEMLSLAEMEKKLEGRSTVGASPSHLSPKHPLSVKANKIEALKKRAETEKAKYLNSVQVTKDMTMNNLKTTLPIVFEALLVFSRDSARAFEAVHSRINQATSSDTLEHSSN